MLARKAPKAAPPIPAASYAHCPPPNVNNDAKPLSVLRPSCHGRCK